MVFQPHTYSRTKNFFNEFKNCFKNIDCVAIYKTYSAREKYIKSGSAKTLANAINGAQFFRSKSKLKKFVQDKINLKYGVLILGAGDLLNNYGNNK